ncbi:MAG: phosphoadenosine phosphosulfate reductase [Polyangiaceae bacterium UTPRO1]|jgi:phosphoadenosine phosphosulfate reductase|nr:phosphoadenylyl-sulfate reductase [Myxococcales bacterium]OQY69270.1 MAG: phosphoadenosine phosphosulfate reductase [Polyangiaceae bacterium UTPRO1]
MLKISPQEEADIAALALRFEAAEPAEILAWTVDRYAPDAVLTCSFQHEGVVLAHMLQSIAPATPVVFIDTGYHFPETLAYRDQLVELIGFNLVEVRPALSKEEVERRHGPELFRHDPDRCCEINKVEPLRRALRNVRAWINGRRRDQAVTRNALPVLEELKNGIVKVNPLVRWRARDTHEYMQRHALPLHPLFERGYASIGCAPCTRPVLAGEDERAGRWAGRDKVECGIHTAFNDPGRDI